jgi:hypothetical protein
MAMAGNGSWWPAGSLLPRLPVACGAAALQGWPARKPARQPDSQTARQLVPILPTFGFVVTWHFWQ